MRIRSLDLVLGADAGLAASVLAPLGELVILAGPNGAGKSRILEVVRRVLSDKTLHPDKVEAYRKSLANPLNGPENQRERWRKSVETADRVFVEGFDVGKVFDFFPKSSSLADHRELNEAQQGNATSEVIGTTGLEALAKHGLAYVTAVERRWFAATHQSSPISSEEREAAISQRERLGTLIGELLGERPVLDLDQQPRLFGRPIPEARLSDGQSILLQIAVALHAKGNRLGELVLVLDEPESHLHPAAVINAIERLLTLNSKGQIWLATHCVPILAAVPTESIWFVKEGSASWAGRRPEAVIEGLLGGPIGRERMEEFLRLPAQLASNHFAAECLLAPTAVMTGVDDPQARQVREFCEQRRSPGSPLRILDFGAGQGRLLGALRERWADAIRFCAEVDYRAFEPIADDTGVLARNLELAYGDNVQRIFAQYDELVRLDGNSVDVVVLCNVLHEIPPEHWKDLFGADGAIVRLLKPDGHVLLLEDMEIPHGEKAHRFGFLLLDSTHLYTLLDCKESDPTSILTASIRDDRLKAHAIPALLLGRVTRNSTVAALRLLLETARKNVQLVRHMEVDSRNGRLHALWTQQLANADLGIRALE